MSSRWIRALSILAVSSTLAGCAGSGGSSNVSGSVLLDGQPLAGADIQFIPKGDAALGMHSTSTDSSGKFQLQPDDNIPIKAGAYLVLVSKFAVKEDGAGKAAGGKGTMVNTVPAVYNDRAKTPLHVDIKDGTNKLPPFELASSGKR